MKINEITNKLFERLPTSDKEMNSSGRKKGELPGDDQLATFIGPKAKIYDKSREKLARKMEKEGYSRVDIWWETGTFRTPNGDWRQEVSDKNLKIKDYGAKIGKKYKFSDLIDHPELYKAYPFLKDYNIIVDDLGDSQDGGKALGQWDATTKTITMSPDSLNRFTAVHELQHAIQNVEKPEDNKFVGITDKIQADVPSLNTHYKAYAAYHKEMMARVAEKRIDYDEWQLKMNPPTNTDTPMMTIQDRKTGPKFDNEIKHKTDGPGTKTGGQSNWNPLKTVPNDHYDMHPIDTYITDPMQKDINKPIRGNVPINMKKGDISPSADMSQGHQHPHPHPHPKPHVVKPTVPAQTNIPKPRPANLGKDQTTTTVKPKPRPADLEKTTTVKPKPRPANLGNK